MPELPEVETVKNAMAEAALGARLTSIWTSGQKMRWPIPADIEAALTGETIIGMRRRGKYIIMETARDHGAQKNENQGHQDTRQPHHAMIIHLGMSGSVRIYQGGIKDAPKKHDHLMMTVDHQGEVKTMVLNDPRRFGGIQLTPYGEDQNHALIRHMGIEPLGNEMSGAFMAAAFKGKTAPIKSALLDQRIIAGIGNIYASEALFLAQISPKRQAKNVSKVKLDRLNEAIRTVLTKAIAAGGTSLRDHVQPGGEIGYFVQQLNVYGKEGEACPQCQSAIKMIRQTGRASFYCSACQR